MAEILARVVDRVVGATHQPAARISEFLTHVDPEPSQWSNLTGMPLTASIRVWPSIGFCFERSTFRFYSSVASLLSLLHGTEPPPSSRAFHGMAAVIQWVIFSA